MVEVVDALALFLLQGLLEVVRARLGFGRGVGGSFGVSRRGTVAVGHGSAIFSPGKQIDVFQRDVDAMLVFANDGLEPLSLRITKSTIPEKSATLSVEISVASHDG